MVGTLRFAHPTIFEGRMAGHRRAEATPFFERLCPAMTSGCIDLSAFGSVKIVATISCNLNHPGSQYETCAERESKAMIGPCNGNGLR